MRISTFTSTRSGWALWPVVVPLVAIGLSLLIGLQTPYPRGRNALLLLSIVPLAGFTILLLRKPAVGLVIMVVAGLTVPFSIGTGTGTSLNAVVLLVPLLAGVWVLDAIIRRRQIQLLRHQSVLAAVLLVAVALLALIAGQLPWFNIPGAGLGSQLGGFAVFALSALAFVLAAHQLDEVWLRRLVAAFLLVASVYFVSRLVPGVRLPGGLFPAGSLGSVFWIWTVALGFGMALFNTNWSGRVRAAALLLVPVVLYVGYFGNRAWASGWAPPAMAVILLIWLRWPRWGWIAAVAAVGVFLVNYDPLLNVASDEQSFFARQQAWSLTLQAARANPILGLGPSNYYFYVEQYNIGGWGGVWNVKFNSHNNWVDIIAQTGILGLLCVLWFAAAMWGVGWKLYRSLPDGFARAYAAAGLAGLVATLASGMLGDWFLPFVYNIGLAGMRSSILFWVFMGGMLALYAAHSTPGLTSEDPK